METEVIIDASGAQLAGRYFAAQRPRALAVVNPATGVAQGYYGHFARWLAEQGISVLTYDYRDFGESARGPVKRSAARMADWGIADQQAARDWLARQGNAPIWVVGHSLGGFMLGFQSGLERIEQVIAVCSGPVHVRDHPWPYQAVARLFWFGVGPALVAGTGYLPGKLSGIGADLPAAVFRQWKLWCTSDGFFEADASLAEAPREALRAPLRSVALADDEMMPPEVVARLGGLYPSAPQSHVVLDPAAHGLGKVGHLAAFARRNRALWPAIMGFDEGAAPPSP